MLDNGSMISIFRQLIIDSLTRLTPFPKYLALAKVKKTSAARNKHGCYWPHQGHKEIARRKRQLDRGQLDFTASGQAHINGGSNYRTFLARVPY